MLKILSIKFLNFHYVFRYVYNFLLNFLYFISNIFSLCFLLLLLSVFVSFVLGLNFLVTESFAHAFLISLSYLLGLGDFFKGFFSFLLQVQFSVVWTVFFSGFECLVLTFCLFVFCPLLLHSLYYTLSKYFPPFYLFLSNNRCSTPGIRPKTESVQGFKFLPVLTKYFCFLVVGVVNPGWPASIPPGFLLGNGLSYT